MTQGVLRVALHAVVVSLLLLTLVQATTTAYAFDPCDDCVSLCGIDCCDGGSCTGGQATCFEACYVSYCEDVCNN